MVDAYKKLTEGSIFCMIMALLPGRLRAGHGTLNPSILVRFQARQFQFFSLFVLSFLHRARTVELFKEIIGHDKDT